MFDEISSKSQQSKIESRINRDSEKRKDSDLRKLVENVFDHKTFVRLLEHINKGHMKTVEFVLSTGKEANVYYSTGWKGEEFALKIFRIAATNFKKRLPYIEGDRRFRSIRKSNRGFVYEWASKEFKNLKRMLEAGVNVPEPYWIDQNLLLMQFVGKKAYPAPLLKDAEITNPEETYQEVLENIHKIVKKAGLVHGDLSEYNMLYMDGHPIIIDVSQSVLLSHPQAREFLIRDLLNVSRFFSDKVEEVKTPRDLFKELIGRPTPLEEILLEGRQL